MNSQDKTFSNDTCAPGCCTPEANHAAVATFQPGIDVIETSNEYLIHADVPGASPETVDVNFDEGVLTLKAKVTPRHDGQTRFLSKEYGVGDYERSFRVSNEIDPERITAELKQGVLMLHLPKTEAVKPRKIAVTSTD